MVGLRSEKSFFNPTACNEKNKTVGFVPNCIYRLKQMRSELEGKRNQFYISLRNRLHISLQRLVSHPDICFVRVPDQRHFNFLTEIRKIPLKVNRKAKNKHPVSCFISLFCIISKFLQEIKYNWHLNKRQTLYFVFD